MKPEMTRLAETTSVPVPNRRAIEVRARQRRIQQLLRRLCEVEAETLSLYLRLPKVEAFHASSHAWRILSGSNQSGKTKAVCIEITRACCACDPYGKYPKENGRILAIGLNDDHLADPMMKDLWKPGAFSLIPDEETKTLRMLRADPNDPTKLHPYDLAYQEKWQDSPPIIPRRMVSEVAWKYRNRGVPKAVRFRTGWEIVFRSSESEAEQGTQRHIGWIDEQIDDVNHYNELVRGFMRFGGMGIWSATPQASNLQLIELRERGESGDPGVLSIDLFLEENPFILPERKQEFFKSLNEDEREVRYYGRPAIYGRLIYAVYQPNRNAQDGGHGCEPFEPPLRWPLYVGVDPGRRHCGTVLATVDPEEKHLWIMEAWDLLSADAQQWAGSLKRRLNGRPVEAIVMDRRMGKQVPPGSGSNVAQQYMDALRAFDLEPKTKGSMAGFIEGLDDVMAREEALLAMMAPRFDMFAGTAKLQVMRGRADVLDKQMKYARTQDKNPDKRVKQVEDVLAAMEYLAAYNPAYREQHLFQRTPEGDQVWQNFQEKQRRRKRQQHQSVPGLFMGRR